MNGIQFVTDEKGRKMAVQINLKKHGARLQDFWDGLISESRRNEKGIPLKKIKADLVKRGLALSQYAVEVKPTVSAPPAPIRRSSATAPLRHGPGGRSRPE
jgi:hypothetical protein